jgi:SAM-dependent methyltransferase
VTVAVCRHPGGLDLTDRLVAAAGLPAGAAVLDVGCGAGAAVARLVDEHGLGAVGLDASERRIAEAAEARPDLELIVGSAEALPFADASFDAVLCECVLSTLAVPGLAVDEMSRVLCPGGAVLVSDLYVRSAGDKPQDGGVPTLGDRRMAEGLFEAAGLEVSGWSDESGALAQYLWDHAGERAARRAPAPTSRAGAAARGRRLGYFSCLARRHHR